MKNLVGKKVETKAGTGIIVGFYKENGEDILIIDLNNGGTIYIHKDSVIKFYE